MKAKFFASLLLIPLFGIQSASAFFSDIGYSWYKDSIITLSDEKVISGFGDGTFGPEKPITRAEILKVIFLTSGQTLSETPTEKCFKDVPVNMWYHSYICEAQKLSIANGFANGTFQPNATVTTLEAIAFGLRAFGMSPPVPANGDPWYVPVQKFVEDNNIIPTHEYTLATKISRGKATELILKIRTYKASQKPLTYASPGCSVATPTLGTSNTIEIAGKTRGYLLYVPANYSKDKQYSLIVASHGRTNSNAQVQAYMGLQGGRGGGGGDWGGRRGGGGGTVSTQDDFIVAYPAGLDAGGGSRSWSQAESVTFFDAVIQQISNTYCVDRSNVFLVGHSLGGWFTHKLACLRGEVVHGMAGVASAGYSGDCTGPVASLLYQNTNDQLSSYASGVGGLEIRKSVNGCNGEPKSVTVGPLSCKKWSCSSGNPVVWCEGYSALGGDPHSWPTTGGTDILGFFRGL